MEDDRQKVLNEINDMMNKVNESELKAYLELLKQLVKKFI